MNGTTILTAVIVVVVAVAGIALFLNHEANNPGQANLSTYVILKSGTIIIINPAGTNQTSVGNEQYQNGYTYYTVAYRFNVSCNSTLSGSWESTNYSFAWSLPANYSLINTPVGQTNGTFNQTLAPGSYFLVFGGNQGDKITIVNSIEMQVRTNS